MKTLKLTGNFELGHRLNEACETVEAARSEMGATEYGSQEYFDALKAFKSAQAEHAAILKERTDAKAHNAKLSDSRPNNRTT